METGEFAVLPSRLKQGNSGGLSCVVFSSLAEAEAYSRQQVSEESDMRCRIYDTDGFGKNPTFEICSKDFKEKGEMSRNTRRCLCGILLIGGCILFAYDWANDFRYLWPSTIGARMVPTGLILLAFELGVWLNALQRKRRTR